MDSTAQSVVLQPALPTTATRLLAGFTPTSNSLVLAPSTLADSPSTTLQRQLLYQVQHSTQQLERREFLVHSYTLFASLQKIAQEHAAATAYHSSSIQDTPVLSYYSRLIQLYTQAVLQQFPLIEADSTLSPSAKNHHLTHHAALHSILSLTEILYLPHDGRGDGVIGEEILDWVNTVDLAPSAEEGAELADLSRPWEHPNFWPYLYRCILRAHILSATSLLTLLSTTHPSPALRALAALPVALLASFPRSTAFRTEAEFLAQSRQWRAEVKRKTDDAEEELYAELEEDEVLAEDEDVRLEMEAGFRCLMELMGGVEARVLDASEDWREALGAWGVWVNPGGRRAGVPETLQLINKTHPVDSTLPSEAVQASLILGDVPRALQQSHTLSLWLSAHLSDLLTHLGLLDSLPASSSLPHDLRTHFLLAYADTLQMDPSLWRVTVDYLACCGEEGRARMRGVLRGVVLSGEAAEKVEKKEEEGEMVVEGASEKESAEGGTRQPSVVEEVLRVCAEQGLEEEMLSVCKVWSEQLIAEKRYGEAVSFCVRAEDSKRIARIAERVLEEYVVNGQESFIHHVDSIPTSLLRPHTTSLRRELFGEDDSHDGDSLLGDEEVAMTPLAPYSSKLSFLARYRDFFAFYARGDRRQAASLLVLLLTSNVAPKGFYAIMLLDVLPLLEDSSALLVTTAETYELLRCLEEITAPISATGVDIYGHLDALARLIGGGSGAGENEEETKEVKTARALKQLDVVRGALARHLGRCCCL